MKQQKLIKNIQKQQPAEKIHITVDAVDKLRSGQSANLFNYKDLERRKSQTKLF